MFTFQSTTIDTFQTRIESKQVKINQNLPNLAYILWLSSISVDHSCVTTQCVADCCGPVTCQPDTMAELRSSGQASTKPVTSLAQILRSPNTAYGTLIQVSYLQIKLQLLDFLKSSLLHLLHPHPPLQSPSPFWASWGGQHLANTLDFVFIDTEHTPLDRQVGGWMCRLWVFY